MRVLSYVLFLTVASALVFGIHYYLWVRLVRDPQWPVPVARAATFALVMLALLMPLAMLLSRFGSGAPARAIAWVAFVWMGLMALSFSLLALSEILRATVAVAGVNQERRALFGRGLALLGGGLSLGLGAWGLRQALKAPPIQELSVPLKRLPPALDGFTLVQVTDIHVGPTIRRAFIEDMVAKVNALAPDLVCITGDLVDGTVAALRDEVAPLASLAAKHGVFFVTGNHEY